MEEIIRGFKKFVSKVTGSLHLPREIINTEEKVILHISDTPECIYPFLLELIDELVPDVVIHTGDVADNIKLGLGLSEELYKREIKDFIEELEKRDWTETYIVPGNHDSPEILEDLTEEVEIKEEGSIIEVDGIKIGLSHFIENLPPRANINLFGHDEKTFSARDKLFLNGILSINVILLPSKESYFIPYPWKTKTGRKYRRLKLP